jgi:hypothetical protein
MIRRLAARPPPARDARISLEAILGRRWARTSNPAKIIWGTEVDYSSSPGTKVTALFSAQASRSSYWKGFFYNLGGYTQCGSTYDKGPLLCKLALPAPRAYCIH